MKTVLITGATSGIGKATASLFSSQKIFKLVLCGRRIELLTALSEQLQSQSKCEIQTLSFDIRSNEECIKAIDSIQNQFSKIDILINNAGLAKGLDFIHEGKLEDWETMIDTNVKGLLYITRLISKGMVERKSGHIINVCSTAGKEVYPKGNVYCASKFAVDALTKAIRQDLYMHNIRVSQVAPGHVEETEFALNRFDGDSERAKIYNDFNPLKAADVAEAIYFIASRPPHVNIQDVLLMGTQQASSTLIDRSGRKFD
jgi:NADP-dependent 3-hydroxy acid dehydrogenase YdfG